MCVIFTTSPAHFWYGRIRCMSLIAGLKVATYHRPVVASIRDFVLLPSARARLLAVHSPNVAMPLEFEFAAFWNSQDLSDIQVVIQAPGGVSDSGTDSAGDGGGALATIPAHKIILCSSPFFKAQIMRWQQDEVVTGKQPSSADSSAAMSSPVSGLPSLPVILQHPSQEPAAMAVLAALYGVKPIKDLLSELPGEQQLQAALLADMWQLLVVSTAAVGLLVDAAKGPGLSEEATKAFLGLSAIPNCLLPVFSLVVLAACFAYGDSSPSGSDGNSAASGRWWGSIVSRASLRRLLLAALGDLEAVWTDPALAEALMGLPVPAMDLLLSCDGLQVASEDTVMYTAEAFLKHTRSRTAPLLPSSKQCLMQLIRCPQLSEYWLSALALSSKAAEMLLSPFIPQTKQLLLMRLASPSYTVSASDVQRLLPGVPPSWALGPRVVKDVSRVQATALLNVDVIRAAARLSGQTSSSQQVMAPTTNLSTPPLGGLSWGLQVECSWDGSQKGSRVKVSAPAHNALPELYARHRFTLQVTGSDGLCVEDHEESALQPVSSSVDWKDLLAVGVMPGGWDGEGWAAAGLPSDGQLAFTLTVTKG